MRVIAGKYGSRPLRSLRGLDLRPTSDRLRETLFNVLGPTVAGSVFVDLYAGTGAVGIEALSRGADEVIWVEKDPAAVKLIRSNLRSLDVRLPTERAGRLRVVQPASDEPAVAPQRTVSFPNREPSVNVLAVDAGKAIALLHQQRLLADFIFLDPPYAATREYERTLTILSENRILAPAGRVIVETLRLAKRPPARRQPRVNDRHAAPEVLPRGVGWFPPDRIGALELTRTVEQGDSLLVFYRLALAA